MYTVSVSIQGVSPLLQHRFPIPELKTMSKGGHQRSGSLDYTEEWRGYFYADPNGQIYQPATHLEGALVKAATAFKIAGKRGLTYKDLFKSAIFVKPEQINHEGHKVPQELDADGDQPLYLDIRPVVVQRARVVRIRPAFSPGWKLDFEIECLDDQIQPEILNDILVYAGRTVGIGDYRPRFGRFIVTEYKVHK